MVSPSIVNVWLLWTNIYIQYAQQYIGFIVSIAERTHYIEKYVMLIVIQRSFLFILYQIWHNSTYMRVW